MSKKKLFPVVSFQGFNYINTILRLVEDSSRATLNEQIISPGFIYSGSTKTPYAII